jgi:hypothetical protein
MSESQAWRRWATAWAVMICGAVVASCWALRPEPPRAPDRYRYERITFSNAGISRQTLVRVDTETGIALGIWPKPSSAAAE